MIQKPITALVAILLATNLIAKEPLSSKWDKHSVPNANFNSVRITAGPTPSPWIVSNGADDGVGSLRAIVRDAPTNSTIQIAFAGIISLTSNQLLLDKNLTITGPGSGALTISTSPTGGLGFRIIEISPNSTVTLSGLTLSHGYPIDTDGGAILNGGMLTLSDVRIAENNPVGSGFPVQNTVNGGGCVNSSGATLVATNCSFVANGCNGSGGAILNSGHLTLSNSTISGNQAGYGGGLFSGGTLIMMNCTVTGNAAISTGPHGLQGGYGGGLSIGGSAELSSNTISGNSCVWQGGGMSVAGTFSMSNCILAANVSQTNPQEADIQGVVQSSGYNLVGVSAGNNGFGSTDLVGTSEAPLDPRLGPLQDNGGLTFTMALLPDSPAVDHGLNQSSTTADQRGSPRVLDQSSVRNAEGGDGMDIGAFELETRLAILGNISTRLSISTGDNAMIGGFIITGTEPKTVIIRGLGPSSGIPGALADPVIDVYSASSGQPIASNDNWNDAATRQQIIDSGFAPTNDLESALWGIIDPGAYTVVVQGSNMTAGIGLFEVYDLDATVDSKLGNISTRGLVERGDQVMIGGSIIIGDSSTSILLRAIGPSLTDFGLPNALANPAIELHDGNGAVIAVNDNWRSDQEAEIIATGIPPTNDMESAIVRTLNPGGYTAIVRGVNDTTGVALVEVYQLSN